MTYTFNAASNQFAVFSEIYYKSGWKAYIDGKEAPIVKVNYVLRGLAVPAGKHDIKFEFKPQGYYTGKKSYFNFFNCVASDIGNWDFYGMAKQESNCTGQSCLMPDDFMTILLL